MRWTYVVNCEMMGVWMWLCRLGSKGNFLLIIIQYGGDVLIMLHLSGSLMMLDKQVRLTRPGW